MLQLYHHEPTANSAKPLIALHEKNIPFESCWIDLHRFEQHEARFLEINPNGQVPVLVVDGRVITESTVINEYIDEVFREPPLRPSDPIERAQMRIWTKFVDEYFCPALTVVSFQALVRPTAKSLSVRELNTYLSRIPLPEQRERWCTIAGEGYSESCLRENYRRISVSLSKAEAVLSTYDWLVGSTYSLADIAFFSMARIVANHFPEHFRDRDYPHCRDWLERVEARTGVRAALVHSRLG